MNCVRIEFTNIPLFSCKTDHDFAKFARILGQPLNTTVIAKDWEYPSTNLKSAFLKEGFGGARTNRGIAVYHYLPELFTLTKRMAGFIWPDNAKLSGSNGPRFSILACL
jgi:hypothetical protein